VARQIAREIAACGATPFLDEAHIDVGADFEDDILAFLERADELVVLVTPWALERPYVWAELGAAWGRRIPIVGLLHGLSAAELQSRPGVPILLKKRDLLPLNEIDVYLGPASRPGWRRLRRCPREDVMNEPKVSISYSHEDAEWVRRFAEALREQNVNVWLDEWQVTAGEPLREAIEAGLRSSDAIVSVLTRANAQRPNVLFVLGVALGKGKLLIPIIPPDLESSATPFELRTRRYLMKGAPDDAARGVAEAVKGKAA